jgi:hypothetical protein
MLRFIWRIKDSLLEAGERTGHHVVIGMGFGFGGLTEKKKKYCSEIKKGEVDFALWLAPDTYPTRPHEARILFIVNKYLRSSREGIF